MPLAATERAKDNMGEELPRGYLRMRVRFHRRWMRWLLCFLAGLLTLLLIGQSTPAVAQLAEADRSDEAAVVVDGQPLFNLHSTDGYPADRRARRVNKLLAQVLQETKANKKLRLEQVNENAQVTIRINGEHLLTVTEADVKGESDTIRIGSFQFQAKQLSDEWASELKRSLSIARQARKPEYLRRVSWISAGAIIITIAIHIGLQWLRRRLPGFFFRWLCSSSSTPYHHWEQPIKLFTQLGLAGLQLGLWAAVLWNVTDLFPLARSLRYQFVDFFAGSIRSPIFTLGEKGYSALDFLILIVLTAGLWLSVKAFTSLIKAYILRTTGTDRGIQETIAILTQYTLTFLGLIVILQAWGIDVSSLAIIASVLGVGIGLGLQNIANDFVSGLIINLERPIQVGDFVNVGNLVGTVERIGARSTEIRTLDRVSILVPNSRFMDSEVINWSHGDPVSRLRVPVGVAYGSDISRVRAALLEAARKHPDVLSNPSPQVWFQEFGDSSLNFELLVWISEPRNQFLLKSDLNYRIETSLKRYGLEVPFPQRDMHLRTPQLDDLIANWLRSQRQPGKNPKLYDPNRAGSLETTDNASIPPINSESVEEVTSIQFIEDIDLEQLAADMHAPEGVSIQDRRYRFNTYPQSFVGSEAVAWMVHNRNITRESAVRLGQLMIDRRIIRHVLDEHPFRDGFFFYCFTDKTSIPSINPGFVEEVASIQFIEDIDLEQLATEMRAPGGVSIQDRRYRLSTYPKSFVGSEAVAWIARNQDITRESAVRLGQLMVDRRIIHHVLDEHPFQDGFFFYRFYEDE